MEKSNRREVISEVLFWLFFSGVVLMILSLIPPAFIQSPTGRMYGFLCLIIIGFVCANTAFSIDLVYPLQKGQSISN